MISHSLATTRTYVLQILPYLFYVLTITIEIPIVCFVKFRYTTLFLTSLEPHISKMKYSL